MAGSPLRRYDGLRAAVREAAAAEIRRSRSRRYRRSSVRYRRRSASSSSRLAVELRQKQLEWARPRSTSRCPKPDGDLVGRLREVEDATMRNVASTGRSGRRCRRRPVADGGHLGYGREDRSRRRRRSRRGSAGGRSRRRSGRRSPRPRGRRSPRACARRGLDTARERRRSPGSGPSCARCRTASIRWPASQAAGELPMVDVLPDQSVPGRRRHGDARDPPRHGAGRRASGSASAFISDASFADNIRARCASSRRTAT